MSQFTLEKLDVMTDQNMMYTNVRRIKKSPIFGKKECEIVPTFFGC